MRSAYLTYLIAAIFSYFSLIIQPFGVGASTAGISRDAYYALFSYAMGEQTTPPVHVLAFDDRSFAPGDRWPLSYARHAHILGALSSADGRAKAVMVDWAFIDERADDIAPLVATLRRMHADGVALFVAAAEPGHLMEKNAAESCVEGGPRLIHPALAVLADEGVLELVSVRWPEPSLSPYAYPLDDDVCGRRPAAVAMHAALTGADVRKAMKGRSQFEVVWYGPPSRHNLVRREPDERRTGWRCGDVAETMARRMIDVACSELVRNMPVVGGAPSHPFRAPYHRQHVLGPDPDPVALASLAANAVVLYGSNLAFVQDLAPSPVYERALGVEHIAMALSNLLQDGASVRHVIKPSLGGLWPYDAWVILLTLALLVFREWLDPATTPAEARMRAPTAAAAACIIAGLHLAFVVHASPSNFLGIFGAFTLSVPLLSKLDAWRRRPDAHRN